MIQYKKYKTDKVPFFVQTEIVGTALFRRRGDFACLIIYIYIYILVAKYLPIYYIII